MGVPCFFRAACLKKEKDFLEGFPAFAVSGVPADLLPSSTANKTGGSKTDLVHSLEGTATSFGSGALVELKSFIGIGNLGSGVFVELRSTCVGLLSFSFETTSIGVAPSDFGSTSIRVSPFNFCSASIGLAISNIGSIFNGAGSFSLRPVSTGAVTLRPAPISLSAAFCPRPRDIEICLGFHTACSLNPRSEFRTSFARDGLAFASACHRSRH
mmetsp:Transcript_9322/g.14331  ORF Transcript_9322/g.14331 Transcript_9322/m.14331 type:complete len:213 (+) Transcript_9322:1422-2060(+)